MFFVISCLRVAFCCWNSRLTHPHCTAKTGFMPGESDQHLDELRVKIDALDEQIVALLNDRARVVVQIGQLKQQSKTPIYAPDREKVILQKVRQLNRGPLPDRCLEAV